MMKQQFKIFSIGNKNLSAKSLLDKISSNFSVIKTNKGLYRQIYFDTFDWRVYKNGLTLVKISDSYYLRDINGTTPHTQLKTANNLDFWWNMPEGVLKSKLKPILSVRALTQIVTIENERQRINIVNSDEKTVVKVDIQKNLLINGRSKQLINNIVVVEPVRGYMEDFSAVDKFLIKLPSFEYSKLSTLEQGLLLLNKKRPSEYSSKVNVKLSPRLSSLDATLLIYKNLALTMKQNKDGIIKDIDTEFLHDFRVAIRRTRSALSQIKEVLPIDTVNKFKKDFSQIGKMTNRLRDLDVYLLKKEEYKGMVSEELHSGLELIFKKLRSNRNKEQKKIVNYLNTELYKKGVEEWKNYLNGTDIKRDGINADRPVLELAKELIWKKSRQIAKKGSKIDGNTPDEKVHTLRIECKKLRYLIEFFSSLFPKKEVDYIIKHFKKLQDNLGDFNDLYTQQKSLKELLNEFNSNDKNIQEISMAVGGLIAVLNKRQREVRDDFSDSFKELSKEEYTKIFNKLFSPN